MSIPRLGLAYSLGTSRNVVFRAGAGLFHGIIPSPLLMCQAPSCGGLSTYPGRPFEDSLNAKTGLFSYASAPFITMPLLWTRCSGMARSDRTSGVPKWSSLSGFGPCDVPSDPNLDACGFLQTATIVRFDQNSQNPYGIQTSASLEFQPFKDSLLSITGIHLRGVHFGSFYNVNQPDPSGTVKVFNSKGQASCKNMYFDFAKPQNPGGPIPTAPICANGDIIPRRWLFGSGGRAPRQRCAWLPRSGIQRLLRGKVRLGFRLRWSAHQHEQADDEQFFVCHQLHLVAFHR